MQEHAEETVCNNTLTQYIYRSEARDFPLRLHMMEQVNPQQSFTSASPVLGKKSVCWGLDATFLFWNVPERSNTKKKKVTNRLKCSCWHKKFAIKRTTVNEIYEIYFGFDQARTNTLTSCLKLAWKWMSAGCTLPDVYFRQVSASTRQSSSICINSQLQSTLMTLVTAYCKFIFPIKKGPKKSWCPDVS